MTRDLEPNIFHQQIEAAQTRLQHLQTQSRQFDWSKDELVMVALEELSTALAELHAAAEEVHEQHESLMMAHNALEIERQRYRDLFEFAPNGYLVTDTAGHIQEVNQAAIELLGTSRHRLIKRLLVLFVPLAERQVFRSNLNRIQQTLEPINGWECHIVQPEGKSTPCELSVSPICQAGRLTGLRWLMRDISERQRITEMEATNRVKDEFLAIVSHELRSPLNPILGWSKLLRHEKLDAPIVEKALETIERNAMLQTQLVEDLLDISRILRSKLSLNRLHVNLEPIVTAALETVQLAAEAKNITLQFDVKSSLDPDCPAASSQNSALPIEPQPPLTVLGDPVRLQQIVWNLVSNAVKFTPIGGRIQVCLEPVLMPTAPNLGNSPADALVTQPEPLNRLHRWFAQIIITDTGKGINPDFLPYVFEYFRQADSSITRKFGGLGLGLAIVRYLVEAHGGTVQAESAGEGQGATFTVRLPLLHTSVEPAPTASTIQHSNLNGLRVLLVDDDRDTLEVLTFMLEQSGLTVWTAASAVEALNLVTQTQLDVLVSDIGMPNIDGYRLLGQIQALLREQGGPIPAIALTAYASEIDQQQAMVAGFQLHIAKPVEPDKLIKAIAQVTKFRFN